MLDRLVGLETEYSLRFQPREPDGPRVPNAVLFERLLQHIRAKVPAVGSIIKEQGWFLASGGAVQLERVPYLALVPEAGLVEGATPECRGPRQFLLHQRAQDVLLSKAAAASGHTEGIVSLLKNTHDSQGNFFGIHENYEATVATGLALFWWRVGLVLLTIAFAILLVVCCILLAPVLIAMSAMKRETHARWDVGLSRVMVVLLFPLVLIAKAILWATAFRKVRRRLLAFLVSRPILTGAGMVHADGRFSLSPRASTLRAVCSTETTFSRGIFYFSNFLKGLIGAILGDVGSYHRLYQPRQRLQLSCGDSNMAQVAEYLKIGTTLLVLDALEAGFLDDAPQLRRPLYALNRICADPSLQATVPSRGGRHWTGLQLQRFYLEACRRYVEAASNPSPEAAPLLQLWAETLDTLEKEPLKLIGKLDWVTKKHLLDEAGSEAPVAVRRKIDLRYHELTKEGYYLQLEAAGVAPTLVEPEEVLAAIGVPPEGTPAAIRGRLIRQYAAERERIVASWGVVILGTGPKARVIPLTTPENS
jgi:proteasome accessory factor A